MHRIRKEKNFLSFFNDVFVLFSFKEVFIILLYLYLISVFPCWSVFFPIYGRKYSMKVKLLMENMWEFSLCFHFVPYKFNIPMYAGEFFYVFYLFHTTLIFPCMQGDLNKSHVRNMFVGYKWKFTFQTKPLWGFATVYRLFSGWAKATFYRPLHFTTALLAAKPIR